MAYFDEKNSAGSLGIGNPGSYGGQNTFGSMYEDPTSALSQTTGIGDGIDWGGWAKGFGSVASGVGGLAQAWQGMQGLKLAKNQLKTQNEQWEKNYQAQRGDIAYDRSNRAAARARQAGPSKIS